MAGSTAFASPVSICSDYRDKPGKTSKRDVEYEKCNCYSTCTEYDLNGAPLLPSKHIEITRESDAGQQIGEEDIDGAGNDQLIEGGPVRDLTLTEMLDILLQQPSGPETESESHENDWSCHEYSLMRFIDGRLDLRTRTGRKSVIEAANFSPFDRIKRPDDEKELCEEKKECQQKFRKWGSRGIPNDPGHRAVQCRTEIMDTCLLGRRVLSKVSMKGEK
ncbi:MAG: hypothetical protein Q9221_002442 [Calogaya cf. arnoldii]